MNKDRFASEIKSIMDEEVKDIELSQELKDRIFKYRKKGLKEKINEFLNKEIEIPLVSVVAISSIIFLIIALPRGLFKIENTSVINIGSFQIIIRDERSLDKND